MLPSYLPGRPLPFAATGLVGFLLDLCAAWSVWRAHELAPPLYSVAAISADDVTYLP